MTYYLGIDIGASSGRHMLGCVENGKLTIEEIYRFENQIKEENGSLVWDIQRLEQEVIAGIKKCDELGKIPQSIAIDTWGVDYVLLDEEEKPILPAYCYRDSRTAAVLDEVASIVPDQEAFSRTGIAKQTYNTIYQLYCDKKSGRLAEAKWCLLMPAYLSFCLTGQIKNEYTICSTGGFIHAKTFSADTEMLEKLGISPAIFGAIDEPGTLVGNLKESVQKAVGFDTHVVFCPSHDTASAVASCPMEVGDIYISSGTWSLIGTEKKEATLQDEARLAGFTNEGGIERRYRFLKNYMGMWLFQNIRRNLEGAMTYDEMMEEAQKSGEFYKLDVNAQEFVAPKNMIEAIRSYLNKPDLPLGVVINSVYHSLALSYKEAVEEIERIAGVSPKAIHIVGGGSKDRYLNSLTAQYTGKKVTAGPVEATVIGNLMSQIKRENPAYTIEEMRLMVAKSFEITEI